MKKRYQAVVAYEGTDFAGWQIQPQGRTVQGALQAALREITGEDARVNCSGRTDTGVHARAQVVHVDLETDIPARKLLVALNARLPEDVRIRALRRVPATFDARFSATGKEYRYFIWNDPVLPPHLRRMRAHVRTALDLAAMRSAAKALIGRHDFAAFCANPGYERHGTVRTLFELRVGKKGPEFTIVARGEGFLYRMVRSLAGFLIRVGTGELPASAAAEILESRVRTARVPTAPAQGLFLWKVDYGRGRRPHAPHDGVA